MYPVPCRYDDPPACSISQGTFQLHSVGLGHLMPRTETDEGVDGTGNQSRDPNLRLSSVDSTLGLVDSTLGLVDSTLGLEPNSGERL